MQELEQLARELDERLVCERRQMEEQLARDRREMEEHMVRDERQAELLDALRQVPTGPFLARIVRCVFILTFFSVIVIVFLRPS